MNAPCETRRKAYAGFGGRIFRVVKAGKTGLFWAVGNSRGARPMFLDKLGSRPDRDEMQQALDDMAARHGWKAVQA